MIDLTRFSLSLLCEDRGLFGVGNIHTSRSDITTFWWREVLSEGSLGYGDYVRCSSVSLLFSGSNHVWERVFQHRFLFFLRSTAIAGVCCGCSASPQLNKRPPTPSARAKGLVYLHLLIYIAKKKTGAIL